MKRAAAVAGGSVLLLAGFLFLSLGLPYAGFTQETFVDIPPGTSASQMAELLEKAGVIRSRYQFLLARALDRRSTLQAGEYRFNRPASPWDVYSRIARGDVFYHELIVPEGFNRFDIARALEGLGLPAAKDFLKESADPSLVRDLAPEAPSLEGYLFPSTYRIARRMTARQLCERMVQSFRRAWRELNRPEANVHRTVTLASLVEKETSIAAERPTIASVFENRLRLGMTLDCDPTVIYAALLEGRWRGTLYQSDLNSPHPYNTYRHRGLPPGPIANPGLASLKAALNPAETKYIYFVATGDGSGAHHFSSNYAEHLAAVRLYRRATAQ
jgi:UPF0755 protein